MNGLVARHWYRIPLACRQLRRSLLSRLAGIAGAVEETGRVGYPRLVKGYSMFIGHLAIGFGAKKAAPRTSLGLLLLASVWSDVVFAVLLFFGIERVTIDPSIGRIVPIRLEYFPWSHSLVMTIVWALLLGGLYYAGRRYRDGAVWIGLGVLSHWVTDWASHRPDMPIMPGGLVKFGLGLYNHPLATFGVEAVMFSVGVGLYVRSTTARDAVGRWGLVCLVVLL